MRLARVAEKSRVASDLNAVGSLLVRFRLPITIGQDSASVGEKYLFELLSRAKFNYDGVASFKNKSSDPFLGRASPC